jgi:DNA-binding CsgD family transcriptional regulator/tetratricopeptide (TPR) repeat protein
MVRPGSSPILIGREEEMARLLAASERAAAGQSAATVFVLGEAGVGKSRLVAEFLAIARQRGGRTLSGSSMEIDEANLPYVPILEALRPIVEAAAGGDAAALEVVGRARHDLARLFPELGPSLADGESPLGLAQTRLFGQVLGVLGRLGQQQPVVLVIEDLQWADHSTRELVGFLARTLHSARVVLILTVRTDALHARHPLTPLLVEATRGERVERITVERLTRREHDLQVAAILGAPPDRELLAQTYARSDGNPFYTEELLAPDAGRGAVLSTSLREVLLARIRGLRDRTRAVLRVVAVGYSVTHPLLEAVAGVPEDALLDSLREAVDRAILTTDPGSGRYRFRHPLIAEAIYDDLLPGERLRLHRRFAEALEVDPALADASPARAPAELANHWLRAGDERRAVPWLIAAARAASDAFAQAEAFGHLEVALAVAEGAPEVLEETGISVAELARMAAEAAEAGGAFARAVQLWERTLALHDADAHPTEVGLIEARAGEAYWLAGDREAFEQHRRRAVALVPADPPSAERSWVLSRLASALLMGPKVAEGRALAEEAVNVAREVGARSEEGRALGALGMGLLLTGEANAAVAPLREALAISSSMGRAGEEAIDRSNLSEALHEAGELAEALAVVREGLERIQAAGLQHTYGETINAIAVDRAYLLGDWQLVERLTAEGQSRAPRGLPLAWLSLVTAEFEASRGRIDLADAALATVDRLSTAPRVTGWTGPHEQRSHVALFAGRPREALDQVMAGLAVLDARGELVISSVWRWLVIHGLRAIGDLRDDPAIRRDPAATADLAATRDGLIARFEAHRAAACAVAAPSAHLRADIVQVAAEAARAEGRADPDAWAAAAATWTALDHALDAAVAHWRHGEALLHVGGRTARAAAKPLGIAHRAASSMGALPIADAVENLARRAGIVLDGADAAPPGVGNATGLVEPLTPRELEVLSLVVAGRSNPEIAERLFITPKTASVHLTNIKGKLGVGSRIEAATAAIRLGIVPPPVGVDRI